jgi:hypothetical protein
MTPLERIQAEIRRIPEDRLDELYGMIRQFVATQPSASRPTDAKLGIMAKLREVQIEAPPDFAANLDLYLSGEKSVDETVS